MFPTPPGRGHRPDTLHNRHTNPDLFRGLDETKALRQASPYGGFPLFSNSRAA
jgi:hypothetical protein